MCNTLTTVDVDNILVIVKSKIRKYSIWALCLYFAIVLTSGVNGSVLCVIPDEKAKVEAVCQTSCGGAETSCDVEQPGVEAEVHPHCIGCTDIPLIYESLLRRDLVSNFIDDSSLLSPTQVIHAEVVVLTATRVSVPPDRGPLKSPHLSLSTTILIC